MHTIFAAIIMLLTSIAAVYPAQARDGAKTPLGYGTTQAPVGHRQPTRDSVDGVERAASDKKTLDQDNELINHPASQDNVGGAGQVNSEESALAKRIEQENDRLDRLVRGICRGC